MARSLLQSIQDKLGQAPEQAKATGAEQGAGRLLQSKLTGKATGVTAPTTTSDAAQAAIAQTQAGLDTQAQQNQVAASQIAGQQQVQQQQAQQAQTQADLDRAAIEQRFDIEQQNLIRDLSRADRQLDTDKYRANLEQLGFMSALSDKRYIEQLTNEGRQRRFDDGLTFSEGLQEQVFADTQDLFRGDLDFKELLRADEREFAEKMADLNIDHALQIAEHDADAASTRAIYGGLGATVSGATQAYAAYDKDKKQLWQ